jgi:hypothetical protein
MFSRLRKLPFVLPTLLAVLALSACGQSHTRVTTGTYAGEDGANAPYLYVGSLTYEVQLSRQLNPFNAEDAAYLQGVPAADRKLSTGQEWFAVFMQVYNSTPREYKASNDIVISDTENNTYTPLELGEINQFAYRASPVAPHDQLPTPGTIADDAPAQGQLLLYKIQIASLDNRPLQIKIVNPENPSESASAELDV